MKKIILLFIAFISLISYSQEYVTTELFDMAGVTGDTIRPVSFKVNSGGTVSEVVFTNTNCNTLQLYVGYGLTDTDPAFPATFTGLTNPVTLDKTTITQTYLGITSNIFVVDFSEYNANYYWFKLIDDAGCTAGKIYLRTK